MAGADREAAEALALEALNYLISKDDLLQVFLGSTGLRAADLRGRLDEPETLAAVLDFILMDDAWVAGFARAAGVRAEAVGAARAALPGGALPHWT